MDATACVQTIRETNETELSRLGSSKSLFADTGGEMESAAVLEAAATAEYHAAATYDSWAETETGTVAEAFATTAAEERSHYERVTAELDAHEPGPVPPIQSSLRDHEETVERLGGFIGRTLAAEGSKTQITGFFVGNADPQTASLFREMGDDLDAQLARARSCLDEVCDDDAAYERAAEAASAAIEVAYETYTDQLESLGVNPKPVC
ncbi:rubrerythrin family protein [Halorubrum sp. SY-15]|uniref:rubrerythrin family protein n=1 Tax=Halorubrum sp. SY-15 TaxID=3402277 RepID=UPI003EBCF863